MKKLIILFCLLVPVFLYAQDEDNGGDDFQTIFSGKDLKVSGFGGPLMSFTSIDNNFAHMMGGGGGVIINNFFFGGYGMGLTTEIQFESGEEELLEFGHGGLWFGFIMNSKKAIHPSIHVRTGWGAISKYNPDDYGIDDYDADEIFVVTPTLELEANISRFFKLGAGGSYTFLYGSTTPEYPNEYFNKPSVFLSFKFGWFQ